MPDNTAFTDRILAWFAASRRDLPWRRTYAPYAVWVSEIMAQQTQMERAAAYFTRFMAQFPELADLAAADEEAVLKAWEGLGYYSRARNLHRAAQRIVAEHGGAFPQSLDAIRALPGIGDYTAAAIASIAFRTDAPVVDANVGRVLARAFDIDVPIKEAAAKRRVGELAAALLPAGQARDFNQGLMELGALVCRPKTPDCPRCPVADCCEARRLDIVAHRPVTAKARDIIPLTVATGVLVHDRTVFIQKRLPEGAWAGLWEFPGGRIEPNETPEAAIVREFQEETGFAVAVSDTLPVIRHGYTTFRVTLHCFRLRLVDRPSGPPPEPGLTAASQARWVAPGELDRFAFPAGHRKLIDWMRRESILPE